MPPILSHTPEAEELAALYALGVLEGEELESFTGHLAGCDVCLRLVREDSAVLASVGAAVQSMEASTGFKERLMQQATAEVRERASYSPQAGPAPHSNIIEFPWWRRLGPQLLAVAAAVLLAVGGAFAGSYWYGTQPLTTAVMQGDAGSGLASVVVRRSGESEVVFSGLQRPAGGEVYVAWVIGSDGKPVNSGFTRDTSTAIKLTNPPLGRTVALSREKSGDVATPTTNPFLLAPVAQ